MPDDPNISAILARIKSERTPPPSDSEMRIITELFRICGHDVSESEEPPPVPMD